MRVSYYGAGAQQWRDADGEEWEICRNEKNDSEMRSASSIAPAKLQTPEVLAESWSASSTKTMQAPSNGQTGAATLTMQSDAYKMDGQRAATTSTTNKSGSIGHGKMHSSGESFYAYGPPGTPHSNFVRLVSSTLPYAQRPQRPGRTINDWLVETESVDDVLTIVTNHGSEFDSMNAGTAIHRIAKWYRDNPNKKLFQDQRWKSALTHVKRNLPAFQTRHLSGALWSFATLGYRGDEFDTVIEVSQERLQEFTCIDLALTAWSIATLKIDPNGLHDRISGLSVGRIGEFQPQALANIAWATATLRKDNDALIRNVAIIASKHMDAGLSFRPHELSTLVWSMVQTQAREDCFFHRVSQQVVQRVAEFGPQELTNTVWAFAAVGVKTNGLFEAIGEECRLKLKYFNTQNITNVTWSYTHLNVGSPELLADIAHAAQARVAEMNVQDLAQLALSLVFVRREAEDGGVLGTRELTVSLVKSVILAMVEKLRISNLTYPDDAWIVHDLALVWLGDETEMAERLGQSWHVLDGYMRGLYDEVANFMTRTPLLAHAQPCGAVVQSADVHEYERAFRGLDLRSLGIKYTSELMHRFGLIDLDDSFARDAHAQLEADRAKLLISEPGAGSQTWCVFRFQMETTVAGAPVGIEELKGIKIRSCGYDPVAFELLEPPREAHLVAVKLSNDRLNHRRRDAEFRALAHTAGLLRTLVPNVDELMVARLRWGDRVQGWLQIYVTEVPCLSCLGAMVQFTKRFPNVRVKVSYPGSDFRQCGS